MKRLNIVVPYRDRQEHLSAFVPHVRAYFSRDKVDREIPYRVTIVEQEAGLPFNRGLLKNVGFVLGADVSDYTCFHDVDYLPIWADYSWADVPTPIVWYGAEVRPIAPMRSQRTIRHDLDRFFGGAIIFPNADFAHIGGYSSEYWGWGYEDSDIRGRCRVAGIKAGRRKGSFRALDHDNEGFAVDGAQSRISQVNHALFRRKWSTGASIPDDLAELSFDVLDRRSIPATAQDEREAVWEIVTVRPKARPFPEQLDAFI